MSSLTSSDKRYLEELLEMSGGYVLDFTDATFGDFFLKYKVDVHGQKYKTYGTSKAKKLRAFWTLEPDDLVGKVLSEMLDSYETYCDLAKKDPDKKLLEKARGIVARLTGQSAVPRPATTEAEFLAREFAVPKIQKMPIDAQVVPIIEARIKEACVVLDAGAHLSVIFLCGSVLEALLLGVARQDPARFNQANATPKTAKAKESPKPFHEWSLAQLIDVADEVGVLKPDIKQFGHGLRNFRNYIHPHEQMISGFAPDEHTAKVCFQVLKAALANLAGERP